MNHGLHIQNGPSRIVLYAGAGTADVDVRTLDPSGGVYQGGVATLVGEKSRNNKRAAVGFIVWGTGDVLIEQGNGERVFITPTVGDYYSMDVAKVLHTGKIVSAETGTQTADLTTTASKIQLFWSP